MPSKTKRKRTRKRRSWVWRYRRLLYLFGLLVFTALAGAAYVISQIPLPKATAGQAQTSFFTDASGSQLAVLHGGENRVPVTYDRIPKVLIDAVVATEDRHYFEHGGLDPLGIAGAAATARDRALAAMVRARTITAAQRYDAEQQPVNAIAPVEAATTYARPDKGTQYFVDYVRQQLVARFGEDLVLRGGLRVQ